jgi:hypothetical protein
MSNYVDYCSCLLLVPLLLPAAPAPFFCRLWICLGRDVESHIVSDQFPCKGYVQSTFYY